MNETVPQEQRDEIHLNPDRLTERELEALAERVVQKLKVLMQQERERCGR